MLIGALNHDENSKKLIELCKTNSIDFEPLQTLSKTIVKKRIYAGNDYAMRIDDEEPVVIDEAKKESVIEILKNHPDISHIVISDYAKGTIDQQLVNILTAYSNDRNIKILVDTKPKHVDMFK